MDIKFLLLKTANRELALARQNAKQKKASLVSHTNQGALELRYDEASRIYSVQIQQDSKSKELLAGRAVVIKSFLIESYNVDKVREHAALPAKAPRRRNKYPI